MNLASVVRTVGMAAALLGLAAACGDDSPAEISNPGVSEVSHDAPAAPAAPARPADPVVGNALPAGEGSVAVLAVDRFESAGRLFSPPRGREYYAAEVKACSGPEEEGLTFAPSYFFLEMTDKTVADPGLGIKRPELRSAEVPAGGCLSGWVTFTIPVKAEPAFVVYDGAERLKWRIPAEPVKP